MEIKELSNVFQRVITLSVVFPSMGFKLSCDHMEPDNLPPPENLTELTIAADQTKFLNEQCVDYITKAKNVHTLKIIGYQNSQAYLRRLLIDKNKLRKLTLQNVDINTFDLSDLDASPNLEKLSLDDSVRLTRIHGTIKAPVKELSVQNAPMLKTLDVYCPTLINLNFNNSGIDCNALILDWFPDAKICNGNLIEKTTTTTTILPSTVTNRALTSSTTLSNDGDNTSEGNLNSSMIIGIAGSLGIAIIIIGIVVIWKRKLLSNREKDEKKSAQYQPMVETV